MTDQNWRPNPKRTSELILRQESDRERWSNKASYDPAWAARAKLAAQFIESPAKVLDLGAGEMALSNFLPEGSCYVPADLEPLTETGVRLDLEKDELPQGPFDVITMLGVYEYLFNGHRVIENAAKICSRLVISYCCCTQKSKSVIQERRDLGWTTDLSEEEFVMLVVESGFYHLDTKLFNEHEGCEQRIFLFCTKASHFRPILPFEESLNWHSDVLVSAGQTARWYAFLLSLSASSSGNYAAQKQIYSLAKLLDDHKIVSEVGSQLAAHEVLPPWEYLQIAKAFRREENTVEAIFAMLLAAVTDGGLDKTMLMRAAREALPLEYSELKKWIARVPDQLPHDIRPDLDELCAHSKKLEAQGFASLLPHEQRVVIDCADLKGDTTTALGLYEKYGLGEGERFNLSIMKHARIKQEPGMPYGLDQARDHPRYGLLSYRTENIGDDIQSLAALRLIPREENVLLLERDDLGRARGNSTQLIMNGWFGHMHSSKIDCSWPPNETLKPVFVSFHISPSAESFILSPAGIEYLRRHEPIGCRDEATQALLDAIGLRTWFSGCLTSTLQMPTPATKNDDVLLVDLYNPVLEPTTLKALRCLEIGNIRKYTHDIRVGRLDPWPRLNLAYKLLETYSQARLVVTSRLHCALPCIALGTPLIFIIDNKDDRRFSGLRLGDSIVDVKTFIQSAEDVIRDRLENRPQNPYHATACEDLLRKKLPVLESAPPLSFKEHLMPGRFCSSGVNN